MNTFIANLADKISSFFGRLQLKQLIAVVLAGVLLLTTAACSNASTPTGSRTGYIEKTSQPAAQSNKVDALNPVKEYDDTPNAQPLKSKEVTDRATRNTATVRKAEDTATRAKSSVSNSADKVNRAANRAARDAKGGLRDLQSNVDKAGKAVSKSVERAADSAS